MILSRFPAQWRHCAAILFVFLIVGVFCVTAPIFSQTTLAQRDSASVDEIGATSIGPTRHDNIGWHKVVFLNFESGTVRRAKALTERCLAPSATTSRVSTPFVVETPNGPWDLVMVYSFGEAPLEKRWETPAELEILRTACTKAVGDDTWHEYKDLIVRSSALVGFSGRLGRTPGGL